MMMYIGAGLCGLCENCVKCFMCQEIYPVQIFHQYIRARDKISSEVHFSDFHENMNNNSHPVNYVYHKILRDENKFCLVLVARQILLITINNVC